MKVGLFVTGHFRDSPKIFDNYSQFFNGNEVDVYVASWSNYDVNRNTQEVMYDTVDIETISKNVFGNNLKGTWVGDVTKYVNGEPPVPGSMPRIVYKDYARQDLLDAVEQNLPGVAWGGDCKLIFDWMQRLLDQYYVMYNCHLLAESSWNDYDVCVRIRADQSFLNKPPIPIQDTTDGIHVNGYCWYPQNNSDYLDIRPWGISDQLAWGKPKWMKKYFEYCLHYSPIFGPLIGRNSCGHRYAGRGNEIPPEVQNTFYHDSNHMLAYYLLKFPYFNPDLNTDNFTDYDLTLHHHGFPHQEIKTPTGVIVTYDYYDIVSKWRYGA